MSSMLSMSSSTHLKQGIVLLYIIFVVAQKFPRKRNLLNVVTVISIQKIIQILVRQED